MLKIGIEEPVQNNESLYQKKNGSDELFFDKSRGLNINRYSVIGNSFMSDDGLNKKILNAIFNIRPWVYCLACWLKKYPGKSTVYSKAIYSKMRSFGWDFYEDDVCFIAYKKIGFSDIFSIKEISLYKKSIGFCFFIGDIENIKNIFQYEVYEFLSKYMYFVPNNGVMESLVGSNCAVIYAVDDVMGNEGYVIAGDLFLDFKKIFCIEEDVLFFEGQKAYEVFI